MAITITPYIPRNITVHLGYPGTDAENVTVSFPDYIKNVASCEVYPTWEPAALRANILAQISFTLNRVYTEHYPSRGYDYDITSSTAVDQKFIYGRNIFENIDRLVDELFTTYIRRQGFVEPLAAQFCNGTTSLCSGMSQWGSQDLAAQGADSVEILRYYYGNDIELVSNAPVRDVVRSYPGAPLRLGSTGENIVVLQFMLNRVSQIYVSVPKVTVNGLFDEETERAVRRFQNTFNLAVDGVVGKATWYKLVYLYVDFQALTELASKGQIYTGINLQYPDAITPGEAGEKVRIMQFFLAVISNFSAQIPPVEQTGLFDRQTEHAVLAFQRMMHLPMTGTVGEITWNHMLEEYLGIYNTIFQNREIFPGGTSALSSGQQQVMQSSAETRKEQYPGVPLSMGSADGRKEPR